MAFGGLSAEKYCGQTIPDDKLPPSTLMFYENDNGGNRLMRHDLSEPGIAETLATGSSIPIGGPARDPFNGHVYFMIKPKDGDTVNIERYDYLSNTTVTVFSDADTAFPFISQAPRQNPLTFDPLSKKIYYYSKGVSSASGQIVMIDVTDFTTTLSMTDAVIAWTDPCDTGSLGDSCLVDGALYRVTLKVDCQGRVWFNEGLKNPLTVWDFTGTNPTRTVVLSTEWTEDATRCKPAPPPSPNNCNIVGFDIDTTDTDGKIWFTFKNVDVDKSQEASLKENDLFSDAYKPDSATSIWTVKLDGTKATQVYGRVNHEQHALGMSLGAISVDQVTESLLVVGWFQNAGSRYIFRLPLTPPAGQTAANFYGFWSSQDSWNREYGPYRAIGEVLVSNEESLCAAVDYNTLKGCVDAEIQRMYFSRICSDNKACDLRASLYPAAGQPQILLVPGKTNVPVKTCPTDSPVLKAGSEQVASKTEQDECSAITAPGDTPVLVIANAPYASRKEGNGPIGVKMSGTTADGDMIWIPKGSDREGEDRYNMVGQRNNGTSPLYGPVIDRISRKMYYIKCSSFLKGCEKFYLIEIDMVTGEEKNLYENDPWNFPAFHPTRSVSGRWDMAFDQANKVIYWITIPAASVYRQQLFSISIKDKAARSALKTETNYCFVRMRKTWELDQHEGYAGLAITCTGVMYIARAYNLYKFDTATNTETLLFTGTTSQDGVRSVTVHPSEEGDFVYFCTDDNVYKCDKDCSEPAVVVAISDVTVVYKPISKPSTFVRVTFDPKDSTMYILFRHGAQGKMGVLRYHPDKDKQDDLAASGKFFDQKGLEGYWAPSRYPDNGSPQFFVVYPTAAELSATFNGLLGSDTSGGTSGTSGTSGGTSGTSGTSGASGGTSGTSGTSANSFSVGTSISPSYTLSGFLLATMIYGFLYN